MTLPMLNEAGPKDTSIYDHSFHVVTSTFYNSNFSCQLGGTGACYTINQVSSQTGFSINTSNLSAIVFTVAAGITDRFKIDYWKLVHKIVVKADGALVGFAVWSFTISDPCASSLLTLTVNL